MSAFVETEIWPVSQQDFLHKARLFATSPRAVITTRLQYMGGVVREWYFFCEDSIPDRGFILRRLVDDERPLVFEYVRASIVGRGTEVSFFPMVCIKNEQTYVDTGLERFVSLRAT